jgi:hypothetical protein
MEAASRPSLELLVDLPLEEPLDAPPREPPTLVAAAPVAAPAPAAAAPAKDLEQTDINFIDPALLLAHDDLSGTVPIAPPAAPLEQPAPLEIVLEDPIIDELLTSPVPPATRPGPAAPEVPGSAPGASGSASSDAQARAATRVPIARTAALTAAAAKLAAASAAQQQRFADRARSNLAAPAVPAARPAPPSRAAARPKPADQPAARVVEAPRVEAPSFAGWASARAATAQAIPARSATPKAAAPAPTQPVPAQPAAAQTPSAPVSPPMDRDFIARNQVVERYLSGRLPLKGATDFERFCHQHPELLDEIGLPERVNAGLRLLEASGKPEPWQEAARPPWQKPQAILGLAAAALLLVVALAIVAAGSTAKSERITALQKQAFERALDPATSTREIRLLPSRSGASNTPAISIGGGSVQLADFKIDESRSPHHSFRVTIDRIDQGRVAVITNLTKDSNGHLRIALNSSALGPGSYQLTIEGINWRGDPEPDSWITIRIVR